MTVTTDLLDRVEPFLSPDLEGFVRAVGVMFAEVEGYAADSDEDSEGPGVVGWGVMLDPDLCPAAGLPYLAQWMGERLAEGVSEADARQWIKDEPNQVRGTPAAIARAAQRWLTGTRTVWMKERSKLDGTVDSDWLAIITYTSETPNPARVQDELRRKAVPADIELDYLATSSAIWSEINGPSWATILTDFGTWAGVQGAQPGFAVWPSNYS